MDMNLDNAAEDKVAIYNLFQLMYNKRKHPLTQDRSFF